MNVTRENGARFLRKATANERERLGVPEETEEAWLLMDDTAILEKAKQALRQKGQHHGGDSMIAAIKRGKPQKRRASQRKRSQQKTEKPSQVQSQAYVDPRIVDLHVSDDLQVTNDVLDMEPLDWRTYPSCQTKVQYEYQGNITQHSEYANQSQESLMTRGEEARAGAAFRASADWSDDSLTATTMVVNDDECEEEFLGKRFYPFSFQGNNRRAFEPWEGSAALQRALARGSQGCAAARFATNND